MCKKIVPYYAECSHSSDESSFVDSSDCPNKDCENPPEEREYHAEGLCIKCRGVEPFDVRHDGPTVYHKHCFQSEICDHEWGHMITDVDRNPYVPEIVLVTPKPNELCPDCHEKGYDERPGGTNPPPSTASIMPRDFEDLPRQIQIDGNDEIVPAGTSIRPGGSRVPSGIYNSTGSRVPASVMASVRASASMRPSTRPSEEPSYSTYGPSPSQKLSTSQYPSSSRVPTSSQYPSTSRAPTASHPPSTYSTTLTYPSKASTTKPTTQAPRKTFGPSAAEIAKTAKLVMTAEDYLKRGAPKNVAASAFYDNADGAAARAQLGSESTTPSASSLPRPSEVPRSVAPSSQPKGSEVPRSIAPTASKSPFESRTQAPLAGAAGADLEEMMAGATLAPGRETVRPSTRPGTHSQMPTVRPTERASNSTSRPTTRPSERPSASVAPQASRTPAGHSVYPVHGSVQSNFPSSAPSGVPRSEVPRSELVRSEVPRSEVPRSEALRPSHIPSHAPSRAPASSQVPSRSRAPAHSQAPPRSHAPAQTALPNYKTMASPGSAYPSWPPPSFKTKVPKPNGNANERVSNIPEGH